MTLLRLKNNWKFIVSLLFLIAACKADETPQSSKLYPTSYSIEVPKGFPKPYLSASNALTVEGILLGKMLYSDSILSTNGKTCTSCHKPSYSYSSPIYISPNGSTISVPPHINLGFKNKFNWEGSQYSLDTLAMGDFEPAIFNTNPELLFKKLKEHPIYPTLFKQAFNIDDIDALSYHNLKKTIAYAIAQYLRSRVSSNSKFDKFSRKEVLLNQMEYEGYMLFFSEKADCFHCHSDPLFSDQEYHNNGVSAQYIGFDQGRYAVTNNIEDMGKFITPTLRNIELTAPYMHDGRFNSLEEVIDHYNHGVNDNIYVDPLLTKRDGTKNLYLTPIQKLQLVAFLKTLTDLDYIK